MKSILARLRSARARAAARSALDWTRVACRVTALAVATWIVVTHGAAILSVLTSTTIRCEVQPIDHHAPRAPMLRGI